MASNASFYGDCKVCECAYMGSADNACACTHPTTQHIPLGICRTPDCDCEDFESPENFAQCFNCLHDSCSHGEAAGICYIY